MNFLKPSMIVFIFVLAGCGDRSQNDKWRSLEVPGLPKIQYPASLAITPDSGMGEKKWTYTLKNANGSFQVDVGGFFHIPEQNKRDHETTMQYLDRTIREETKGVSIEIAHSSKVIRGKSFDKNRTLIQSYFAPNAEANGAAIKWITLSFPSVDSSLANFIEESWLEGLKQERK